MSIAGAVGSAVGSIIGAGINAGIQNDINEKNANLQREFAQNSIQWKVADAKKAGIHPLAAIGAPTYSASPSFAGADVGGAFKDFGQAVSGLMEERLETQTEKEKQELRRLELENRKLEQDLANSGVSYGGVRRNVLGMPNPDLSKSSPIDDFKGAFSNDPNIQLVTRGDGTFKLGYAPDSLEGQSMSEGILGLAIGNLTGIRDFKENKALQKRLREEAIKAGILKPNEDWRYIWTPHGYIMKKIPAKMPKKIIEMRVK